MKQKNETLILTIALLTTGLIAGGGLWWLWGIIRNSPQGSSPVMGQIANDLEKRFSEGARVLVPSNDNETKLFAAKAIAEGNTQEAINLFTAYLQKQPNDPEAWIYLNNAKAVAHNPLKIAVVVPITSNLNVAQEMLRGSAQAQHEINQKGGINGRYLSIMIADDSNEPDIAKQVAQTFANKSEILAVVGHNASNASLSAAPVYQSNKLVMVNPTSFANGIADVGNYVFRAVPTAQVMARSLADNIIKSHQKIAICYDSQAPDGVSFMQDFIANFLKLGGQQAPIACDLSNVALNPQQQIQDAIAAGADSLLLLPHIDRLNKGYDVANANKGRLKLYGNSTLATIKTLEQGLATQGLIVVVPWSSKIRANRLFAQAAKQFWGGNVSWRTAGNYDATSTVIKGLEKAQSRDGLQKALEDPKFAVESLNGRVKFLPNGDRAGQAVLLQVKPSSRHQTGYDFIPIRP